MNQNTVKEKIHNSKQAINFSLILKIYSYVITINVVVNLYLDTLTNSTRILRGD